MILYPGGIRAARFFFFFVIIAIFGQQQHILYMDLPEGKLRSLTPNKKLNKNLNFYYNFVINVDKSLDKVLQYKLDSVAQFFVPLTDIGAKKI